MNSRDGGLSVALNKHAQFTYPFENIEALPV